MAPVRGRGAGAGDEPAAQTRLGQEWMTDHSVYAVGAPLLARGVSQHGLGPDDRIEARLPGPWQA